MALCAEMLVLGKLAATETEARAKLQASLDSGSAAERFARMVVALGGPADLMENPDRHLERSPIVVPAPALARAMPPARIAAVSAWPWSAWVAAVAVPPIRSTSLSV
jgi:hypothetical protein